MLSEGKITDENEEASISATSNCTNLVPFQPLILDVFSCFTSKRMHRWISILNNKYEGKNFLQRIGNSLSILSQFNPSPSPPPQHIYVLFDKLNSRLGGRGTNFTRFHSKYFWQRGKKFPIRNCSVPVKFTTSLLDEKFHITGQ